MGWQTIVHKREDLFKAVWAEPMTHVAAQLGISDVALAKVCRRMDMPRPGRGYWARRAAGWPARVPQLRPPKPGTLLAYDVRRYVASPAEIQKAAEVREEIGRHASDQPPLAVPEALADPHPWVARSLPALQRLEGKPRRATDRQRCLDIFATGEALLRACRIMDTLLKAFEERGYSVEVTSPQVPEDPRAARVASRTLVRIGESAVRISIEESVRKSALPVPPAAAGAPPGQRPKRQYEYKPTGVLNLCIDNVQLPGSPTTWTDRKADPIERRLNEFVASVEVAAERLRLARLEEERQRVEAIREAQRERAFELQEEAHQALGKDLEGRLSHWRLARGIETFAAAVRESAPEDAPSDRKLAVGQWLEWSGRHRP